MEQCGTGTMSTSSWLHCLDCTREGCQQPAHSARFQPCLHDRGSTVGRKRKRGGAERSAQGVDGREDLCRNGGGDGAERRGRRPLQRGAGGAAAEGGAPSAEMGGGAESLIAHLLQLRRPSPAVTSALLLAHLIDEALLALRKFMLIPHLRHHQCYHSCGHLAYASREYVQSGCHVPGSEDICQYW